MRASWVPRSNAGARIRCAAHHRSARTVMPPERQRQRETGEKEQTRAIDFKMDLTREPDPKGDCVKIVMSGKYLPNRTY